MVEAKCVAYWRNDTRFLEMTLEDPTPVIHHHSMFKELNKRHVGEIIRRIWKEKRKLQTIKRKYLGCNAHKVPKTSSLVKKIKIKGISEKSGAGFTRDFGRTNVRAYLIM